VVLHLPGAAERVAAVIIAVFLQEATARNVGSMLLDGAGVAKCPRSSKLGKVFRSPTSAEVLALRAGRSLTLQHCMS